ncbi:hypothetical protein Clacol_005160 [Clathrus columnatus]|uniref:Uncharacterized protein n=1 Tax=Clathrus columnatus TaxID=1419009 RepID=A0AAV5AD52_9AGAM|nr:hypothetical protein Clacol_005160 [Clathrus columnatus]
MASMLSTLEGSTSTTTPPDLVYDLLVEIYIEYLHQVLAEDVQPSWNAFTVLPLVSRLFYSLSQPLFRKIFGERDDEPIDYRARIERFTKSKAIWHRTRTTTEGPWDPIAENFSPSDIPRVYNPLPDPSLLKVYDLVSLARYYFVVKAVHLEDEKTMCTLRLWCPYMGQALGVCDDIYPRRLLRHLGPHVAFHTTDRYSLECLEGSRDFVGTILKHSQSLNFSTVEFYIGENLRTLEMLEINNWDFLWLHGYIHAMFPMSVTPDALRLQTSGILDVLQSIVDHDWVEEEYQLKERASKLLEGYAKRIAGITVSEQGPS